MVVEITLETVGIAVGILGSIGAGASAVLVLFGNSKWATRQAVHDLANTTTTICTAHDTRITKIEGQLGFLAESLARLARSHDDATAELRKHSESLASIVATVNGIAHGWDVYKRRNGPLNPD